MSGICRSYGCNKHKPNGKVTGTLEVSQYYTGVQEPAESLGEPGDLYFLVEE